MTEKSPNSTITNTEIEEWIEEEEDEVTLSTFEVLDDSYFKNICHRESTISFRKKRS